LSGVVAPPVIPALREAEAGRSWPGLQEGPCLKKKEKNNKTRI
jgi:hypothetical protein